jgi:hypothetical protein
VLFLGTHGNKVFIFADEFNVEHLIKNLEALQLIYIVYGPGVFITLV